MRSRLIAGIFSIALVLLVVVVPLFLAEKLETIETSQDGIVSASSISSETTYKPYMELSPDTIGRFNAYDYGFYYGIGTEYNEFTTLSWNTTDYWDIATYEGSTATVRFYNVMDVSASDLYFSDITELSIGINSDISYRIGTVRFEGLDASYNLVGFDELNYPSTWESEVLTGLNYYNYTMTTTDLNDGSSAQGSHPHHILYVYVILTEDTPTGTTFEMNLQLNPDHYEITTTSEGETVLVPYIQTMTPYSVHKVSMALGGVLIIIVALIVSPLPIGESFDRFFPVTGFNVKRQSPAATIF